MESSSSSRKHRERSQDREDRHRDRHESRKHRDRSRSPSSRKHKRRDEDDREERRKRKKEERKQRKTNGIEVVDDDADGDEWVEKDVDAEQEAASHVPGGADLFLTSNPTNPPPKVPLPPNLATESSRPENSRDEWMLEPRRGTVPVEGSTAPHSAKLGFQDISAPAEDYGEDGSDGRTLGGGVDFFSSLGTARAKKEQPMKPDPDKLVTYKNELNTQLLEGKSVDEYAPTEKKAIVAGSAGSSWRMMKLRRVYEQAQEESRPVEDVAMERYGNMQDFDEAREERRVLDEREQRRSERRGGQGRQPFSRSESGSGYNTPLAGRSGGSEAGTPGPGGRRFMFMTDEGTSSRPSSRAGFRRPGEAEEPPRNLGSLARSESTTSLAGVGMTGMSTPPIQARGSGRFDSKPSTPIPSVLTPHHLLRNPLSAQQVPTAEKGQATTSAAALSVEALNKLQARALRARLMDDEDAAELEAEYEREAARAKESRGGGDEGDGMWTGGELGASGLQGRVSQNEGGQRTEVQVLPTLDGHGRLYDIGTSADADQPALGPGNRRPKQAKFETRDPKTGEIVRYNADDDTTSLGEMVRQERFGGGASNQKDMDAQLATAIMGDAKFENDLDYMDDNADRFGRKKMKSDAMKRAFAVGDFAKTKKALDSCPFCYQDERPPRAAVVALGNRTYIACTQNEELTEGHCLIVPIQHHLSMLELEDDDWEEIKNHMKCLMQMFAAQNKGVLFYETVINLKHQKHTYIEAVPLPADLFADAPAYFRESILASESEWSQHKKVIDFSARPGGFRRAMVPNLPYFMVQWDYRGEKGYGHVIEDVDGPPKGGMGNEDEEDAMGDDDKGGGGFPRYFAAEIIGNMLGVEPRRWRRPRRVDFKKNHERASKLGNQFHKYDWTLQLKTEAAA